MATRNWDGGIGNWNTGAHWVGGVAPLPGDAAVVTAGEAIFTANTGDNSGTFDDETLNIGSNNFNAAATVTSNGARFGHDFTLTTTFNLDYGMFISLGVTGFAGTMTLESQGGAFEIQTENAAGTGAGGAFVLETNGSLTTTIQSTLYLSGTLIDEGTFTVGLGSTFNNQGTVIVTASQGGDLFDSGTITGGGTIAIENTGAAFISAPVSNQTFTYQGLGGTILISNPATFQSTITNFQSGDFIDLYQITETNAFYNAATGILTAYTVSNGGTSNIATLHVQGPTTSGALTAVSDGAGGTVIEYVGSLKPHQVYIQGGDIAVGANTVRATLTTHGGARIDGTGIKIGIISDSFDNLHGANGDAALGYLPATAGGTSAVTVLQDKTGTAGTDEGRAMAELVHQIAPGAQIYFYSSQGGATGMATGINQMVADGVNIIVDDVYDSSLPFFQVAGPLDTAVQNAINSGVSYFTSASNYGNGYYQAGAGAQSPVNFQATTVPGLTGTFYAQRFATGNFYQAITLKTSATNIDLQWDAPFPAAGGSSPLAVQMVLYDAISGSIVAQSSQVTASNGYASEPEVFIGAVPAGSYDIAIIQTSAQHSATPITAFKYGLFGNQGSYIDDPTAMNGSGLVASQGLVPGVNTVAASSFENSPAFTGVAETEWFSANGPGELLFDGNGNRLATPTSDSKPTFTAPDGIDVAPSLMEFQPFYGTSAAAPNAAAVAALVLQANPRLTPAQVTTVLQTTALNLGLPTTDQGSGLIQAVPAVNAALAMACYATGTRLLTATGERRVEDLRIGDVLALATGGTAPVVWIGHRRVDCQRHPNPETVCPVRVRTGAFGPGRPARDLVLSPDHAVFDEATKALIPVRLLVNGTKILQERAASVIYWHVELPTHALLLAEGLPAESYLDTGNRDVFANAGPMQLHPVFVRGDAPAGMRLTTDAATVASMRARLASVTSSRVPSSPRARSRSSSCG